MSMRTKNRCFPKFHYRVSGLSTTWDWIEFEGEVYAENTDSVVKEIETFVKLDYEMQEITELVVTDLSGKYYLVDEDSATTIVYDDGPIPSWLKALEDDEDDEDAPDTSLAAGTRPAPLWKSETASAKQNDKKATTVTYVTKLQEYNVMVHSRLLPKWLSKPIEGPYVVGTEESAFTKALDAHAPTWKPEA